MDKGVSLLLASPVAGFVEPEGNRGTGAADDMYGFAKSADDVPNAEIRPVEKDIVAVLLCLRQM
jgi:hypothetical protein